MAGKSIAFRSNYTGTNGYTSNDFKELLTAVSPNMYFGVGDPVTVANTSGAIAHAYTAVVTTTATTTQIVGVAMKQHQLGTWATSTTTSTATTTAAFVPVEILDAENGWWITAGNATATGAASTTTASSFGVGTSYLLGYDTIGGSYQCYANLAGTVAATSVATSACVTVLAQDTKNNNVLVKPSVIIRHPVAK